MLTTYLGKHLSTTVYSTWFTPWVVWKRQLLVDKNNKNGKIVLIVYVDNFSVMGDKESFKNAFLDIKKDFLVTRIGHIEDFIWYCMEKEGNQTMPSQPDLITKMLQHLSDKIKKMRKYKTPASACTHLVRFKEEEEMLSNEEQTFGCIQRGWRNVKEWRAQEAPFGRLIALVFVEALACGTYKLRERVFERFGSSKKGKSALPSGHICGTNKKALNGWWLINTKQTKSRKQCNSLFDKYSLLQLIDRRVLPAPRLLNRHFHIDLEKLLKSPVSFDGVDGRGRPLSVDKVQIRMINNK